MPEPAGLPGVAAAAGTEHPAEISGVRVFRELIFPEVFPSGTTGGFRTMPAGIVSPPGFPPAGPGDPVYITRLCATSRIYMVCGQLRRETAPGTTVPAGEVKARWHGDPRAR